MVGEVLFISFVLAWTFELPITIVVIRSALKCVAAR